MLYDIRWSIIFECFKALDTKQFMLSIHNYFINASTHLTPLESILWYVGHYHNALPTIPSEFSSVMEMIRRSDLKRWLSTKSWKVKSQQWIKFSLCWYINIQQLHIILIDNCQFYMDSISYLKLYIYFQYILEILSQILLNTFITISWSLVILSQMWKQYRKWLLIEVILNHYQKKSFRYNKIWALKILLCRWFNETIICSMKLRVQREENTSNMMLMQIDGHLLWKN